MEKMKRFYLERSQDVSGVSGTGRVAEGVKFSDGKVAVRWPNAHGSTTTWNSIEDAETVHGHGGLTKIVWID